MKTKLYVWWVRLQANHMPWTELYKYRIYEWDRMQSTQKYLNSYWASGHKNNLSVKQHKERIKKAMEDYSK